MEQVKTGRRGSELMEEPVRSCPWSLTDAGLNLAAVINQLGDSELFI